MDELEQLQKQIEELQRKAEAVKAHKRAEVLAQVRTQVRVYGFSARDLGLPLDDSKPSIPVAPKYRLGTLTWTGRGRQPRAIADYVEQGGSLEGLLITQD